jgi:hypothetical protein
MSCARHQTYLGAVLGGRAASEISSSAESLQDPSDRRSHPFSTFIDIWDTFQSWAPDPCPIARKILLWNCTSTSTNLNSVFTFENVFCSTITNNMATATTKWLSKHKQQLQTMWQLQQ